MRIVYDRVDDFIAWFLSRVPLLHWLDGQFQRHSNEAPVSAIRTEDCN
jgi:hypothetical protein